MTPRDIEALRAHGLTDRAIHDAAQVTGFFNYITRIADGLGVEPEDFIGEWGAKQGPAWPDPLAADRSCKAKCPASADTDQEEQHGR